MRRKDKQIIEIAEIENILKKESVCRIAMCKDNIPYIVPMNFGYSLADGKFTFYFHCAKEGEKLMLMQQNSNVCFEMDCSHEFVENEIDCRCSMVYESVIAKCTASIISDPLEKMEAVQRVVYRCRGGCDTFNIGEKELESVIAFKLEANEITAKHAVRKA